jgi:hypothetical protein
MKPRSLLISIAVLSITSLPLSAVDTSRPLTQRIGILKSEPARVAEVDMTVRKALPRYLRESLTEAGFKVAMIDRTIEEMTEGTGDDILIDIGLAESNGEPISSIGAGGSIEGVGVGGEVSVIQASAFAEIRVYNAKTLAPLTSLELSGETTQPAFTGIGIGDPHGWILFRIPFTPKGPLKQVARNIARDAAAAIREEFGE